MLTKHAHTKLSVVLALGILTLFTTSAMGQNAAQTNDTLKKLLSIQVTAWGETTDQPVTTATPETVATIKFPIPRPTPDLVSSTAKPVAEPSPKKGDVEDDIAAIKAENAAVREQLRRMEEGQKILIEQLDRMRRRLDRSAAGDGANSGKLVLPPTTDAAGVPDASSTDPQAIQDAEEAKAEAAKAAAAKQARENRYQDGIILWATPDDAPVPFAIRLNNNTQLRYLNTLSSKTTFTDHLGNVRDVHRRNDITVNRSMFILAGYMWDKRLLYSLTVWTSAGSASIVVAGNIGWRFNKRFTLMAGYAGVPGSRSLVNTFPYYTATDRSMADNFFRPGFTQGMWAFGEAVKNLHYNVFLGNSLNTLSISAAKIDTNLMGSGSIWWEPLGAYGEPGKSVNMYDDYFAKKKARVRFGTSFTISREDRFSNLDVSSPENTALYNSDGVLTFSTGAFAPGVTVQNATYKMWAIDGGFKWNGFSVNGQYYMRWLDDFVADGPIPETATFDHGHELTAGYFVVPRKLLLYGKASQVFGHFNNSYEYGGGFKWHFLPTERLWLNAELLRVHRAPYSGAFTPYTAGMDGWVPMIQTVIAF